jgi:hypothetical protein
MQVAPQSDGGRPDNAETLALAPNDLIGSSWHHLWMLTSHAAGTAAHGVSSLAQTALDCSIGIAKGLMGFPAEVRPAS